MSTQKDAEISRHEPSLFVDATPSPVCLSQTESESNTYKLHKRQEGGGEGRSDGSYGALWSAVSEGHDHTKGVHGFYVETFKNVLLNTRERSGTDRQIDKDKA